MSTFSGLSGALSALYAQRRGMDVTGQNIANANTEGYSRQRTDLQAIGGPTTPGLYATTNGVGAGVTVSGVARIQDTFLEARGRAEHAQNSYLSGQKQIYAAIEQAFGEPGDTGLQSQLSEFWSAWHDVANQPGDPAARTQLLQRASTVASSLRGTHDTLASLFTTGREQLDTTVTEVNNATKQVADLNQAVVRAKQAGLPVNELADQRDLLVMRIAELTGATATTRDDGSVDVLLSGSSLVSGPNARTLEAFGAGRIDDVAATPVGVRWADTKAAAAVPSGQLASTLQTLGTILPDTAASLDSVAANLASTVNTQHKLGFDQNGVAGVDFYTGTTAATIAVAVTDPAKIAAASGAASGGGGTLDGSNADALAALGTAVTGPDRLYRQVVVDLGVAAQTANRRAGIQDTLTQDADTARTAQSGVNLDEEMTNLVAFQRAYQAAAKVISTIDATLQDVLNMVGR